MNDYSAFFEKAVEARPFDYQMRICASDASDLLVVVPTGAGKTAAVVLPWLWRVSRRQTDASIRLVYCLPMRSLTEQTAREVKKWVERLELHDVVGVHTLMGGDADERWQFDPAKPAVIVGTQDLILSRMLNRGYAMNPLRWPVPFGLFTNDATWVFDEVQLLGDGLATSLQLQAFREKLGAFGRCNAIWMSATCREEWLHTVDRNALPESSVITLSDKDREQLFARLNAPKALAVAPVECRLPNGLAGFVRERHKPGTLTLVVVNTVQRAVETYSELSLTKGKPSGSAADVVLVHSRFRADDRKDKVDRILDEKPGSAGRIVVSTQVIEAGVDISAELMVTDLAPYSSLVQRFGRINRWGELGDSSVFWVDRPFTSKGKNAAKKAEINERDQTAIALPYEWPELERARLKIESLDSVSPSALPEVDDPVEFDHVLRRKDIIDLFDTSPDLSGNDVDVSRFVRGGVERDVFVAWRRWDQKSEMPPTDKLAEKELCRVPLRQAIEFLKKHTAWTWRPSEGEWKEVDSKWLVPGIRIVFHVDSGGYTSERGWDPGSDKSVAEVHGSTSAEREDAVDMDPLTERPFGKRYRQVLSAHSDRVVEEAERLSAALDIGDHAGHLLRAARCHDWGKSLPEFQKTLHKGDPPPDAKLLAKSCHMGKHKHPHLRHELASALALLAAGEDDLVAYLAAAHHGRVRLTIRSMPDEGKERIRGLKEGDSLLQADLGGAVMPEARLSLQRVQLGRQADGIASWCERMTRLRDELGTFRLAYLEALLRMADEKASAEPGEEVESCQ